MLAELVADGGGDAAAIAAAKGFEAMDTAALEASSTRRSPPTGRVGEVPGRRGQGDRALVGAVMKASRGQADGAAVTAMLRSRRG